VYCANNPLKFVDPTGLLELALNPTTIIDLSSLSAFANPMVTLCVIWLFTGNSDSMKTYDNTTTITTTEQVTEVTIQNSPDLSKSSPFEDQTRGKNYVPPANRHIPPTRDKNGGPEKIPDPSDPGDANLKSLLQKIAVGLAVLSDLYSNMTDDNGSNIFNNFPKNNASGATNNSTPNTSNNPYGYSEKNHPGG
jgi:hypothetical protein